MARRKAGDSKKTNLVRKTVTVDGDQLELARKVLGLSSDTDVLRYALEHLVGHFVSHGEEE
jgi:hypothetical protein